MATGNPYDMRSEDPSERAAAKQWEREQRQTFAQGAGIDYTPGLLTGSGGGIGGNERGISVARSVDNYLNQWANNKHPDFPTLSITPEQRAQVLQQVAKNPEGGFLQYLTPEQRQVAQTMLTFNEQNAGFDGFQKALMAGAIGGFGALAGPSMFGGAAGAEAGGTVGGLSASDAALIDAAGIGSGGGTMTGGFGLGTGAGEMGATLAGGGAELGSGMFNLGTGSLSATGGALGTGTAGIAGMEGITSGGGGGFFEGFGDFLKTTFMPTPGKNDPFSLGNIASAGLNYFTNKQTADSMQDASRMAFEQGNPLNDPRRQPYQQQLAQLLSNPSAFYETNPVVKAQMDLARRQFEANSAKMGVGGTQSADYLKNMQNNAASTFNTQANLLGELAGFKFPGGGGVNAGTEAAMAGARSGAESTAGLGTLANMFKQSSMGQTNVFDAAKKMFDFSLG